MFQYNLNPVFWSISVDVCLVFCNVSYFLRYLKCSSNEMQTLINPLFNKMANNNITFHVLFETKYAANTKIQPTLNLIFAYYILYKKMLYNTLFCN